MTKNYTFKIEMNYCHCRSLNMKYLSIICWMVGKLDLQKMMLRDVGWYASIRKSVTILCCELV